MIRTNPFLSTMPRFTCSRISFILLRWGRGHSPSAKVRSFASHLLAGCLGVRSSSRPPWDHRARPQLVTWIVLCNIGDRGSGCTIQQCTLVHFRSKASAVRNSEGHVYFFQKRKLGRKTNSYEVAAFQMDSSCVWQRVRLPPRFLVEILANPQVHILLSRNS